jgi:hypothetical protein
MFEQLSRLLSGEERLLTSIDDRDTDALLAAMESREFTILGYPQSEGLDPATATEEEFDEYLQWEADQVEQDMAYDAPLEAMSVEHHGRTALLAFTKERYADEYIENLTLELGRLIGVPMFDVAGSSLIEMIPEDTDLLLNPGSDEERLVDWPLLSGQG